MYPNDSSPELHDRIEERLLKRESQLNEETFTGTEKMIEMRSEIKVSKLQAIGGNNITVSSAGSPHLPESSLPNTATYRDPTEQQVSVKAKKYVNLASASNKAQQ